VTTGRKHSAAALGLALALLPAALAGCGGGGGETTPPPVTEGDAAAGAQIYKDAGCGSCHALEAAGSTGTVGPSLDETKPEFDLVVNRVEVGGGGMPSFEGQLSARQIEDVAAYVVTSTSG